jgi:gluconate 2-dehydrogenase gamma chain
MSNSRREFLKKMGITVGAVALSGGLGKLAVNASDTTSTTTTPTLKYFTQEQFAIVEAAAERIFPVTEEGPGAKALGAAFFIDGQMAGPYGSNARMYTGGPFGGTSTQGPQTALNKKDIITRGITALENYSQTTYGKSFIDLDVQTQDSVLQKCVDNQIPIDGINSRAFFNLFRNLTIEGLYSDPIYGGNKNMDGWRMKRHPGHQESYRSIIDKEEFVLIEPQSLESH